MEVLTLSEERCCQQISHDYQGELWKVSVCAVCAVCCCHHVHRQWWSEMCNARWQSVLFDFTMFYIISAYIHIIWVHMNCLHCWSFFSQFCWSVPVQRVVAAGVHSILGNWSPISGAASHRAQCTRLRDLRIAFDKSFSESKPYVPQESYFLLTSSNTAPGNLLVFNKHGLGWGGVGC